MKPHSLHLIVNGKEVEAFEDDSPFHRQWADNLSGKYEGKVEVVSKPVFTLTEGAMFNGGVNYQGGIGGELPRLEWKEGWR